MAENERRGTRTPGGTAIITNKCLVPEKFLPLHVSYMYERKVCA